MWVKNCLEMRVMLLKTENNCLKTCTKHPLSRLEKKKKNELALQETHTWNNTS